jgi:hypothetical protein
MRSFRERIVSRRKWWGVSTGLALLFLLALGFGFGALIISLPVQYQAQFIYSFGGLMIVMSFFLGQITDRIVVRSWDTWLGELGPLQVDMLIPVLQEHKRRAKDEP